jgi:DNA (cytosine-5)-methyltransferase 1
LFSGIEACSVAWKPLGWTPVAFAEVEPFPCAVLAHHYPGVPNLGDVKAITAEQIAALWPIDVVVGGSPCQDLSVAGKRAGLAGERSGLFHEQLRIFHAARSFCGARWLLWENVPGAFSSNAGRDFAVVVGAMAGCRLAVPPDGWETEGVALGESGFVEWAVLDAQWFRLAQRRRRVFAVLDTGDWRGRPPVLLERDGLRGHHPPRRQAWQDTAPTLSARTRGGGGLGTDFDCDGGLIAGAVTSKWAKGSGGPAGDECQNLVAHTLRADGFDASEDGTGRGTPLVPVYAIQERASSLNLANGPQGSGIQEGIAYTLEARRHAQAVCAPAMAVHGSQDPDTLIDLAHTLGRNQGQENAVAYGFQPRIARNGRGDMGDVASALNAQSGQTGKGDAAPCVAVDAMVRRLTPRECERLQGFPDEYTRVPGWIGWRAIDASETPGYLSCVGLSVRQAKKSGRWYVNDPDGPRYRALGNSMAVPVMRWIGQRIEQASADPETNTSPPATRRANVSPKPEKPDTTEPTHAQ